MTPGAAGGTGGVQILFTNTAPSACVVQGYPVVAGMNLRGKVIVRPQEVLSGYLGGLDGPGQPPRLVVGPGQTVSAMIQWADNPGPGCPDPATTPRLRIAAPDGTPQLLRIAIGTCGTEVHPVLGGTAFFATVHDPPVTIGPCSALTAMPLLLQGAVVAQPLEITLLDPGPQYCTLSGFPSVTALDAHGRTIATATDVGSPSRTFLLTGEQASVLISWDATPGCPRSAALTLTPPGSPTDTTMKVAVPICGLRVGPFRDAY